MDGVGYARHNQQFDQKNKSSGNCCLFHCAQGCILLTYLNVISSKFIQKFAQKCQYFTLIDQSVPLYNFYITFYPRTNQLWIRSYLFLFPWLYFDAFFFYERRMGWYMLCTMGPKFSLITFKFSNVSQEFLEDIF